MILSFKQKEVIMSAFVINQPYYHRQYEHDIIKTESSFFQQIQKDVLIALPFFSLYKPFGSIISISLNSSRSFSCLSQVKEAFNQKDIKAISIGLLKSTFAVSALAASIFASIYGMLITSSHDVLLNVYEIFQHSYKLEFDKVISSGLELANNALYVTMLLNGTSAFVSLGIQVMLEVYKCGQCGQTASSKNPFELMAHIFMASIRAQQMVLSKIRV